MLTAVKNESYISLIAYSSTYPLLYTPYHISINLSYLEGIIKKNERFSLDIQNTIRLLFFIDFIWFSFLSSAFYDTIYKTANHELFVLPDCQQQGRGIKMDQKHYLFYQKQSIGTFWKTVFILKNFF